MHHIYHTDAIVCRTEPRGEANKMVVLLTRDLGKIYAQVQGVRLLRSKLRYTFQDFSLVRVDLVRGKDVWRVTSGTPISSITLVTKDTYGASVLGKVLKLAERLIHGEEKNDFIFDDLVSLYTLSETTTDKQSLHRLETISVFRLLYFLGYAEAIGAFKDIVSGPLSTSLDTPISTELVVSSINNALRETQLV